MCACSMIVHFCYIHVKKSPITPQLFVFWLQGAKCPFFKVIMINSSSFFSLDIDYFCFLHIFGPIPVSDLFQKKKVCLLSHLSLINESFKHRKYTQLNCCVYT